MDKKLSKAKDKGITRLIDYLDKRFGLGKFIINDFWDADLCAIGLSDPQKEVLVYISTYGKMEGQYFISIEDIVDIKRFQRMRVRM